MIYAALAPWWVFEFVIPLRVVDGLPLQTHNPLHIAQDEDDVQLKFVPLPNGEDPTLAPVSLYIHFPHYFRTDELNQFLLSMAFHPILATANRYPHDRDSYCRDYFPDTEYPAAQHRDHYSQS
jgi:hypothetical protein